MTKITADQVKEKYKNSLNMGSLRKFIENNQDLPDNTQVLVQRVEDFYFEDKIKKRKIYNGWDIYLVKGDHYNNTERFNQEMREEIDRRNKGEEPEFDNILYPENCIVPLTEDMMDQFFIPECITKDKNDLVLIFAHY